MSRWSLQMPIYRDRFVLYHFGESNKFKYEGADKVSVRGDAHFFLRKKQRTIWMRCEIKIHDLFIQRSRFGSF